MTLDPTASEIAQLHIDVARYLECVDVARTDPFELMFGQDPPAMLAAYPAVEGVRAHRRQALRGRVAAYTRGGRAG